MPHFSWEGNLYLQLPPPMTTPMIHETITNLAGCPQAIKQLSQPGFPLISRLILHLQSPYPKATIIRRFKIREAERTLISKEKGEYLPKSALGKRLQNETWFSLETAFFLVDKILKDIEIIIHIDCNISKKFDSSAYVEKLIGAVVGQGFKCVVKPDAAPGG